MYLLLCVFDVVFFIGVWYFMICWMVCFYVVFVGLLYVLELVADVVVGVFVVMEEFILVLKECVE